MQVEVTQADREAAADIWLLTLGDRGNHEAIRGSFLDHHSIVQAFARHRIEATRTLEAQIAELRSALGMAKDLLDCIVQTPGNTWYVSADDPETAVCDTYSALEAALQHKEPQG